MPAVFIALGSNIEPEKNIEASISLLSRRVFIKALSTFYRTAPEGDDAGQAAFINGVVAAETGLPPDELKISVLRDIEHRLGRIRTADRNAPRTMDLDIVLYDDVVVQQPGLVIPDPSIPDRPFLALPLFEVAPDLVLPDSRVPIAEIAARHAENSMEPLIQFSELLRKEFISEHRES